MSIFGTILEKLGLKKEEPAAPVQEVKPAAPKSQVDSRPVPAAVKQAVKPVEAPKPVAPKVEAPKSVAEIQEEHLRAAAAAKAAAAAAIKPMEMVDVKAKLEKLAKDSGQPYDWKASIVDLLKLLHMDSSLEARKELATELGCPPETMKDSKNMNIWLHKTVMQKIAANGGSVPKELLD